MAVGREGGVEEVGERRPPVEAVETGLGESAGELAGVSMSGIEQATKDLTRRLSQAAAGTGPAADALDRLGLSDNTIIVFWSDHGYNLTEHGQWKKQSLFEAAARVPLFIAAPNAKGNGRATRRVVELVDLYPTLVSLCGMEPPAYLAGADLTPLLNNPKSKWERPAYTQVLRPRENIMGRSIRTERWRYTEWNKGVDGVELYDHKKDPDEYQNLANDPRYIKVRTELEVLLNASGAETSRQTP